jgi:hypothetical protein
MLKRKRQNYFSLIFSVITAILSIAAICISIIAVRQSEKANLLSEIVNSPIIVVTNTNEFDFATRQGTEKVSIMNTGGPIREYTSGFAYIIEIYCVCRNSGGMFNEGLELEFNGYFDTVQRSNSLQGIIETAWCDNNYGKDLALSDEFDDAAAKDGYSYSIRSRKLVWISYKNFLGNEYMKAFSINPYTNTNTASEIHYQSFRDKALLPSFMNANEPKSKGVSCDLNTTTGTQLWDWYKNRGLGDDCRSDCAGR